MKLNDQSLEITSSRFAAALAARNLELSLTARLNVWAQILFKKNHSAAMAEARKNGFIVVGPVSTETIISALKAKNRVIDSQTATELFAKAIESELPKIANYFSRLPALVKENENACLTNASEDRITGLGFIQGDIAGYLAVSRLLVPLGCDSEMQWIRENHLFVADVSNFLAGLNNKKSAAIYVDNHRAASNKEDQHFISFIAQHLEEISDLIAKEVFEVMGSIEREDWESEISFDEIKDIVFDVLDRKFRKANDSWLSPECNAGDAVINHIAGSIRETLKMLSNDKNFYDEYGGIDAITSTANFATRHIIGLQRAIGTAA
jgi:hypothetical protein